MARLQGRRAIVTGASKGLGRRIVEALLAEGAVVAGLARQSEQLQALGRSLSGRGVAIPCEVRSAPAVGEAVARAAAELGGVDILVNNAAMCAIGRIEDASDELVAAEVETNLLGVIWCMREAIPHLRRSGRGHIVNVTSDAVAQSPPFLGVYTATKAGVEALSGTAKRELREHHVRVSIFRVGRMKESSLQQAWDPEVRARFYDAFRASGIDQDNGQAMDPATPARALADLLSLPEDTAPDLMVVRGR